MSGSDDAARRWRRRRRITAALLGVWFFVTFGVAYFARELDSRILGWPFSFWVAAQGSLIVNLVLVWLYARWMGQIDDSDRAAEEA